LTYASAGHPTAFILGRNGEVKTALSSTSLPLGILPDLTIGISSPVKLETGDVAIMFTDGLIEATSPDDEPFGEERVLEVARRNGGGSARSMAEALYGAAVDFAGTSQLADDITMVVVKVE
jgi:sigma-B regulation protein RsbU (phosphoserine phosphatase)